MRFRRAVHLLALLLLLLPLSAFAQPAYDDEPAPVAAPSLEEIERRANDAVSAGRYAEAIPDLEKVVVKAEAITDPETREAIQDKIQRLKFVLSFCYLVAERYGDAVASLDAFAAAYPDSPRLRQVLTLKSFAEKASGNWAAAARTLEEILRDPRLPRIEQLELGLSLGEALLEQGEHRRAYQQLRDVVIYSEDPVIRMAGISRMLDAILTLGDPLALYALVPALQGQVSPARYSLAFNLRAMEAGDRLVEDGHLLPAFVLYKLCQSGADLKDGLTAMRDRLTWQRDRLRRQTDAIISNFQQLVAVDNRLQQVEAELNALAEAEGYDEGLRYRIATVFNEMDLVAEAYWAFRDIVADFPDSVHAPEALYAAGALAARRGLREESMQVSRDLIARFPESDKAADAVFTLAYLHQEAGNFDALIRRLRQSIADGVVTRTPSDHGHALFLIGYAHLYQGNLEEAERWFGKVREVATDTEFRQDADYWSAYVALMTDHFEEAEQAFRAYLEAYPHSRYTEDVHFRIVLARFGAGDIEGATGLAEAFLRDYPTSELRGECHNVLGDLYGALGRLDEALENYALVEEFTDLPDQVHAAVFNAARILEADERWPDIVRHFQAYIDRYGDQGKYTMAVYKMGEVLRFLGEDEKVADLYWKAFLRDANDPSKLGVDLMLRDALQESAQLAGRDPLDQLASELENTDRAETTKRLRLWWGLYLLGEEDKAPLTLTEADVEAGSPAVLHWLALKLLERGQTDLAAQAYRRIIEDFPETDWTPSAVVALGDVERGRGNLDEARRRYQAAYDLYPTWTEGGIAALRLADLEREAGQTAAAAQRYEEILLVREWRGDLWPEALYKLGLCRLDEGETEPAFAYFQRVYVLYGNYPEWTAKAYLASSRCLEDLGRPDEARATYEEMLGKEDLAGFPETAEARERLLKLPPPAPKPEPAEVEE